MDVKTAVEKVKELVRKGNVSKIVVRRKGEVLLSIPVNVGVVGAVVGLAAAKWAVLAAVLGTLVGGEWAWVREDGIRLEQHSAKEYTAYPDRSVLQSIY